MPAPEITPSPLAGLETAWHGTEWAETVASVYGFEDCSLRGDDGCLPLFLSRSSLSGNKLVSAVFNGIASPLASSEPALGRLIGRAVSIARERGVDWLEIKGVKPLPPALVAEFGLEQRQPYWVDALRLSPGTDPDAALAPAFRKHLRRMGRRAGEAGVRLEASVEPRDLDAFHRLLVRRNRDRFATLAQPRSLFRELGRRFFRRDQGRLFLARSGSGELLAGALYLEHAATASGFLSAADTRSEAAKLSLDTLVKHAALRHYAAAGFEVIDLGVTSPSQPSVLAAKARFGTTRVRSCRILLPVARRRIPDHDYATAWPAARALFRWLPLPAAQVLPELLARRLN